MGTRGIVRSSFVIVTALLFGSGAGCDRAGSSSSSNGQPAAVAEVRIGYFANVTHAQAVLGISSGEFADAAKPAKVTTKVFNAGPSLIEALFANEVDIGYVGPGPALSAYAKSKGQGIRVISGAAANGVVIVASKNSGISTLADLKGKRVATPQHGNTQDIAARHYLVSDLKQPDANNVIAVQNSEQAGMMDRGQIDAAWAPEPWGSRLIVETGAKLIAEEKDLWPAKQFSLTVVVTTPEFLQQHADVVKKVLDVHNHWTQRLSQSPDQYASQLGEALGALTGKKLPEGVLPQAIARVKFTNDPLPATFNTMAQWAQDLGFQGKIANLDGLFDTAILKQVEVIKP